MKKHPRLCGRKQLNIHVVNNGIAIFEPAKVESEVKLDPEIVRFCKGGFCIGTIGRLSLEKRFSNLLEAIKIIKSKKDDIRLVIIGEGKERVKLEQKVNKLGLGENVFLPGYKQDAMFYAPYFQIYILSSLTEGLSMTILEIMNSNCQLFQQESEIYQKF